MFCEYVNVQAKLPFDETELQYIAELDANADSLFLQQELPWIPEGSLRILQVIHPFSKLLQKLLSSFRQVKACIEFYYLQFYGNDQRCYENILHAHASARCFSD